MKAQTLPQFATPFVRLPFALDLEQLQSEVSNLMDMDWLEHPQGFAGNLTLPLVSVNGQYNHDFAISGQMLPTPALHHCPYIRQVLTSLQVPISRTRLMLLAPEAEVPKHFDAGYHWYRRVRIHIPVWTHPEVIFGCADQEMHMQAGEVWCFDHRQWHWVKNNASFPRIHLVIDTKGSPDFFAYFSPQNGHADNSSSHDVRNTKSIQLEPYRFEVLDADEIALLLNSIIEQFEPLNEPQVIVNLKTLRHKWQTAFNRYGHSIEGEKAYDELIKTLAQSVEEAKLINHQALMAYGTLVTMLNRNNGMPITTNAPIAERPCYR
ncbi:aspartyl/asparaginyl beta-hydroxylase domain-containing protein [Alteromonas sp. a30]|uniref:aspartyl/asparaginyl beta-hydroxylase domain-containing protein n=1 Tax=Alteromonas sp. a30 TaxID=2730917 RepID=UPI0022828A93|nr:aspartyl/asparaginyl beta-hydroxylase domain-containing protein [Alteromonas sp. a30]MCY7296702.1 hypothetical protein [Alteromonas sp. a30]